MTQESLLKQARQAEWDADAYDENANQAKVALRSMKTKEWKSNYRPGQWRPDEARTSLQANRKKAKLCRKVAKQLQEAARLFGEIV